MTDFLDKLQKKSEREKRRITIGLSLLITAIIFALWLLSFSGSISIESSSDNTVSTEGGEGPIESFIDDFKAGISEIKEKAGAIF